jgi:hypothetical protein
MNFIKADIKQKYEGAQEERGLEFKKGFLWSKSLPQKLDIIKTAIAMFNTPQGGDIILGIEQKRNDSRLKYVGITKEQSNAFQKKEEEIKDMINSYTTININPTFTIIEDESFDPKKLFLVIGIPPYKEYPCLVKKDGGFIPEGTNHKKRKVYKFRKSDLLTRSKSVRVSSRKVEQEELNEMIELCAKGLRTKSLDITEVYNKVSKKENENLDKFKKEREELYGDISA